MIHGHNVCKSAKWILIYSGNNERVFKKMVSMKNYIALGRGFCVEAVFKQGLKVFRNEVSSDTSKFSCGEKGYKENIHRKILKGFQV